MSSMIIDHIESNLDPCLVELTIRPESDSMGRSDYFPYDWKRDGEMIGSSAQIKVLNLSFLRDDVPRQNIEDFFRGVASNRSIKKLRFESCNLYDGELFTIMIPFFKHNRNFGCLEIIRCPLGYKSLVSALCQFDTLKEFVFSSRYYVKAGGILKSLIGHSGLTKLSLHALLGECEAFDDLLRKVAPNLTLLDLENSQITKEGAKALFDVLQDPSSRIEKLNVGGKPFLNKFVNDEAALSLANTLTNRSSLRILDLTGCRNILFEGWGSIFATLQSPHSRLESLNLSWTGMDDDVLSLLTQSMVQNCTLRELNLSENNLITPSGWIEFSDVLKNPHSSLERLDLSGKSVSDDPAVSGATTTLMNSLCRNSTLREFILDAKTASVVWSDISNLLCNTSSIIKSHTSNHTLERICSNENEVPDDIKSFLQINRECASNKRQASRRKIIKAHFQDGFVSPPFLYMDWKILPHAFAWMMRDDCEGGLAHGYCFEYMRGVCQHRYVKT